MAAQQNLICTLKLIRLLKQRPGKTLAQLAQILDCDPRHARRYMDTLEEAGFIIDKEGKRPPRFYLFEDERRQQAEFTEGKRPPRLPDLILSEVGLKPDHIPRPCPTSLLELLDVSPHLPY